MLEWANNLNSHAEKDQRKNYLPYRIHQFIAQTGSVYSTLGNQNDRQLFMDAGLYAEDKDTYIFPLVFSRSSGHEMYCVYLNENEGKSFRESSIIFLILKRKKNQPLQDMFLFNILKMMNLFGMRKEICRICQNLGLIHHVKMALNL